MSVPFSLSRTCWLVPWLLALRVCAGQAEEMSGLVDPKPYRALFRVEIKAPERGTTSFLGAFPVVREWPEQTDVRLVSQKTSPGLSLRIKEVPNTCRYVVMRAGRIPPNGVVTAEMEFTMTLWRYLPDWGSVKTTLPQKARGLPAKYLLPGPGIESDDPRVKAKAGALLADAPEDAAKQARVFWQFVRSHVQYARAPFQGAAEALTSAKGDCEQRAALFVALCRSAGIPARCVGVPGHAYAEFFVEPWGWLPAETAGQAWFAGIPEYRMITVKGDGFRVPELQGKMTFFTSRVSAHGMPQVSIQRELLAVEWNRKEGAGQVAV